MCTLQYTFTGAKVDRVRFTVHNLSESNVSNNINTLLNTRVIGEFFFHKTKVKLLKALIIVRLICIGSQTFRVGPF